MTSTAPEPADKAPGSGALLPGLATLLVIAGLLAVIFRDGIRDMTGYWAQPEYQHGYLIPFVALYLLWVRAADLDRARPATSWLGAAIVLAGLAGFVLGELSGVYTIIQYAMLLVIWGVAMAAFGTRGFIILWAGLVYLFFAIPLPKMFEFGLSNAFQLWSSQIGTAFLRLVGISVYLEGNVIDLGSYKLQVVEACSGLRYLFPLTSFAFFCAYIFRGPFWQRAVIFVSAVPITILMNSFRIAVTGILVNQYGTGQAEGFLHYFEGWIIFVACIALLFLEMAAFALLGRRRLADAFEVEIPELADFGYLVRSHGSRGPVVAVVVLLAAGLATSTVLRNRVEDIPRHVSLQTFPLVIGDWSGQEGTIDSEALAILRPTDYMIVTYHEAGSPLPVELYVSYYDTQRKGNSVHSPKACLPGGGWIVEGLAPRAIPDALADGSPLVANYAVISKGSSKALVYYWFMQRGRYLTSEYLVKWYIFWDSLKMRRTDGAMVRVTVPVPEGMSVEAARDQAEKFIRAAEPKLYYHIPQAPAAR